MSSKAITEKKESHIATPRWHVAREVAPSVMAADQPLLARIIGIVGLLCITIGGVPLAARMLADRAPFRTLSEIMPVWLATILAVGGLGCLLFHAASD